MPDWWSSINVTRGILQVKGGCGGIQILFPIFVPPTQNPKKSKSKGKNKVVVCEGNFKVQKRSAAKATCALNKQSAFLFDRGIEKTQKVVPKVSNRKTFRSSVEHPQSFSRALGKHWPSLIRCTSAVNIYISIYVLYSLYICCFILTVAIASLTF